MWNTAETTLVFKAIMLGTAALYINPSEIRKIFTADDSNHLHLIYKDGTSDVFKGYEAAAVAKAFGLPDLWEPDEEAGDYHIHGAEQECGSRDEYWRRNNGTA